MYRSDAQLLLIYLLVVLLICFINGCVAKGIAAKRGMTGEGFCWGFFLGVVGIIVMRCCPKY